MSDVADDFEIAKRIALSFAAQMAGVQSTRAKLAAIQMLAQAHFMADIPADKRLQAFDESTAMMRANIVADMKGKKGGKRK